MMNIRPEITQDYEAIRSLTYLAFENHPHHEPGAKPTEHLIVEKLRNTERLALSLVVEDGKSVVGHIAFSPITINGKASKWLALAPVSIAPKVQGKGIGSLLINRALEILKQRDVDGVVLIGEPAYYSRFGFNHSPRLTVSGIPAEYFMINSWCESIPSGEVGFDPAFG
ncbi:GNAT family N-acetyltransferase [Pseudoalteromonas piscicida]|uniref:GNAT family N-acetyltransferase n=1 Tax=Pseudoalteromonas piscicida TaxID=43662 RepID=UPI001955275A|nr:N-acetyltransferase [Pseudoalteromonas piscicida]